MADVQYVKKLLEDLTWQNDWVSSLEQARAAVEKTLTVAERERSTTLESLATIRQLAFDGQSIPLSVRDINDCKTQRDVLREIAIHNGGVAGLTEAAELIEKAKMSTTKDGARSNLYHFVTDSEDWTFVGRGKAWLLEFGLVPEDLRET